MNIRNINVAPRSGISFSLIVLLVFILGFVSVVQMGKLYDSEQDVEQNWMASIQSSNMITITSSKLRIESMRFFTDIDQYQSILERFPSYQKDFIDAVKNYEQFIHSDKERELYLLVKDSADSYENFLKIYESSINKKDTASAMKILNIDIRPIVLKISQQIKDLSDLNAAGAVVSGKKATNIYSTGLFIITGIIALAVVLTIALATLLTRSITSPISDALSVAERIANGDLSKDVNITGRDEAGRLLKALSQMQENLRGTIRQIADSSSQLASTTQEMTAVTEESSRGLISQNDEVNQAATAVTEMSAAVDEVARNAELASAESKRTMGFTETGLERVAHTLKSIQKLSGNVDNTSAQIQVLSERSKSIGKVIEVIRAIAEQTNLLALNAAIEAARAGEHGRGFAVVADEVRALAHRTQLSTKEIEQMITEIQRDSEQAVDAMNISKNLASESLNVAQDAIDSLNQIASATANINERNFLISTASEEQSHVAREVDRNLISIRELSSQSSAGAYQTVSACNELSTLAVNLNRMVNRFTV